MIKYFFVYPTPAGINARVEQLQKENGQHCYGKVKYPINMHSTFYTIQENSASKFIVVFISGWFLGGI